MITKINLNKVTGDETEPPDPVYHVVVKKASERRVFDGFISSYAEIFRDPNLEHIEIFEGSNLGDIAHDVSCRFLREHPTRPHYRVTSVKNGYAAVEDPEVKEFREAFRERMKVFYGN